MRGLSEWAEGVSERKVRDVDAGRRTVEISRRFLGKKEENTPRYGELRAKRSVYSKNTYVWAVLRRSQGGFHAAAEGVHSEEEHGADGEADGEFHPHVGEARAADGDVE